MLGSSHKIKSERLQRKRRRKVIGNLVLVFSTILALWLGVFYLSGLPGMTVQSVSVEGNVEIPQNQIASTTLHTLSGKYFYTISKSNILFYPKSSVASVLLSRFPEIENVKIKFKNLHSISVRVKEREVGSVWCGKDVEQEKLADGLDRCFAMDQNGLIFSPLEQISISTSSSSTLIRFFGGVEGVTPVGQYYVTAGRFKDVAGFIKNWNVVGVSVKEVYLRSDNDFDFYLDNRSRIIVGKDDNLASAFENLKTILTDPEIGGVSGLAKIQYVDLRFGSKVYYKLR